MSKVQFTWGSWTCGTGSNLNTVVILSVRDHLSLKGRLTWVARQIGEPKGTAWLGCYHAGGGYPACLVGEIYV